MLNFSFLKSSASMIFHYIKFDYMYYLPFKKKLVAELTSTGGIVKNFPANNNIKILLKVNEIITYINENNIILINYYLSWV